jgi:hypothetical protein
MPRTVREKSKTGINHIIFRGMNHVDIFLEKDDFKEYMCRLKKICDDRERAIIGYKEYIKQENNDKCMEYKIAKESDSEVYKAVVCLM